MVLVTPATPPNLVQIYVFQASFGTPYLLFDPAGDPPPSDPSTTPTNLESSCLSQFLLIFLLLVGQKNSRGFKKFRKTYYLGGAFILVNAAHLIQVSRTAFVPMPKPRSIIFFYLCLTKIPHLTIVIWLNYLTYQPYSSPSSSPRAFSSPAASMWRVYFRRDEWWVRLDPYPRDIKKGPTTIHLRSTRWAWESL